MSYVVWRQPGSAADDQTMSAHRVIPFGTLSLVSAAVKTGVWHRGALVAASQPWPG